MSLNPQGFRIYHRPFHPEQGLGKVKGPSGPIDGNLITKQLGLLLPPTEEEVSGRGDEEQVTAYGEDELGEVVQANVMSNLMLKQGLQLS